MLTYWAMYVGPALLALHRRRHTRNVWYLLGLAIALLIGLRYQVGGDWGNYLRHFDRIAYLSLREVLSVDDPGYYLLNWVASQVGAGIWLVNLFCAALFTAGLFRFVRRLPDPMLALAVAVPYMVTVVAMGYSRQAAAFGCMLWALVYLHDNRQPAFVVTIALAATFHQSAVLLVPLAILATRERRLWTAIWVGISSLVFFLLFLGEQRVERLWTGYVISEYAFASEGGPIRVLMNTVPAVVLLAFYRRFEMIAEGKALWFWMAVFSLAALPLVFQAPTAVDRVALYLMPIQLVVWSHFPMLFVKRDRHLVRIGILAVYGAVLFVWLNYAAHAYAWVPYRFWLLQ